MRCFNKTHKSWASSITSRVYLRTSALRDLLKAGEAFMSICSLVSSHGGGSQRGKDAIGGWSFESGSCPARNDFYFWWNPVRIVDCSVLNALDVGNGYLISGHISPRCWRS